MPIVGSQTRDRNRLSSHLLSESLVRNPQFEIVDVTGPDEVLASAFTHKPDLLVLSADFDGGRGRGLHLARSLSTHQPEISIVMLVDSNDKDCVVAAFRCGAMGVFCRTEPASDLWVCLQRVSQGEIWAGSAETQHLLQMVRKSPSWAGVDDGKIRTLAKREMEVAELASRGQSNKQIAAELKLSEHTVKNYLLRVFEKLNISNRFELLFLLYSARDPGGSSWALLAGESGQWEAHLKAAEQGFPFSQFMVGMAYWQGRGIDKNPKSAYYWLRMAHKNSTALRHKGMAALEHLNAELKPDELAALDRKVETSIHKRFVCDDRESTDPLKRPGRVTVLRQAV